MGAAGPVAVVPKLASERWGCSCCVVAFSDRHGFMKMSGHKFRAGKALTHTTCTKLRAARAVAVWLRARQCDECECARAPRR